MWFRLLLLCPVLFVLGCQTVPQNETTQERKANNQEAAEINLQAGLGYLRQQQPMRALAKFEKALQQQPKLLDAQMGKAAALQSLGRTAEAEQVYVALLAAFPGRYEPPSAYAGLMCEQKRFKEAETTLLNAVKNKAFGRADSAYVRLARCAVRGQRPDLAELYLNRAQDIATSNGADDGALNEIALQSAWLAFSQQQYAVAQERLEKFERQSPLRADAVQLGYQIAKAQNNLDGIATYEQILRQNYPQIWNQISNPTQ